MSKGIVRCAIYTRKSTEEGLDQSFNSLHAQREACAAYIRSQAGEGWKLLSAHYDDGGFSGGNMARPALQRMLADIDHGRIDCVVVYKIDRLTRSLADFAKIVERFDQRQVTFVSVTQSFNTTTSMGRLTLNVLLSFAQFEREVTAERIRDKFAASRAKGIFMGGMPPLGYDAKDRKLVINEAEAKAVRFIFKRYLDLRSVARLREELEAKGVTTKAFVSTRGNAMGGGRWYVGPLRHLLRNPVYVGLAKHKGKLYPGAHEPIIERPLFDRVQAQLDASARTSRRQRTVEASGLLTGLIFDDKGNRMSPQWSIGRGGSRHGYYVSQALLQRRKAEAGSLPRVSAPIVEDLVLRCVMAFETGASLDMVRSAIAELVHSRVSSVVVGASLLVIELKGGKETVGADGGRKQLRSALPSDAVLVTTPHGVRISIAGPLRRRGGIKRVEGWSKEDWSSSRPQIDRVLLNALVRAHRWRAAIERGDVINVDGLATREGLHRRRVRELLRLAFLAPDIQRAIVEGRQPRGLNLERLIEIGPPAGWHEQRRVLGLV
jgi:DNA invertase Pin-like site-specific DNA recombinase